MIDQDPEEQREAQKKFEILKAEDIAVGVEYILTQPARCTVSQLVLRPSREKRSGPRRCFLPHQARFYFFGL